MAYEPHQWEVSEPITKTRMRTIEQGIADAHTDITGINSVIGDRGGNSNTIMSRLSSVESTASTAASNAADALSKANEADAKTTPGANAWTQVNAATQGHTPQYTNLDTRFTRVEDLVGTAQETADAAIREIGLAHDSQYPNDTLDDRFDRIETTNSTQTTQINTLISDMNQAAGTQDTTSLKTALERIQNHIDEVKDEVEEARGTKADGTDRDTLLEHFVDDEALIATAQQTANTANTEISKVKAAIGNINFDSPAKTVTTLITEAQTAANSYTDTEIANNNTVIGASEIAEAHTSTANDTTYASLDARFEATETRLNAIDNSSNGSLQAISDKVDTIATELAMYDQTGAIVDTNTRVDTIEANVLAMGKEIGMIQDGAQVLPLAEAISTANTRIDSIASEIEDARGNETSLDDRFNSIESDISTIDSDINTTTTGIKAVLAATKQTADLSAEDIVEIKGRLDDLEANPTTSTVVLSNVQFVNDEPLIDSPSPDIDYLIKNGDNYYYWKYINNAWHLISGAGGGGTSSAVIVATLPNAADANVYTDYFIGTESEKYIHYRFIDVNGTLRPIIISNYSVVDQDNVKSYQVATIDVEDSTTGEVTTYLDFYGFDYGTSKTSDEIDPEDDLPYRIAHLPLPKGGGAGEDTTSYRIYGKVRGDSVRRISYIDAQSQGITLQYGCTCYNYDGDSYDYRSINYSLAREGDTEPILTNSVNSLSKDDYSADGINITIPHIEDYCETNKINTFILTLSATPPPSAPDEEPIVIRNKAITVYVTVVELKLESSFSDQQTYSTNNSLFIPYTFTGMEDIDPSFTVLLDNNPITPTITSTNIVIRQQDLANLTGIHNLQIKASQTISGAPLYSNPLNYQLGFVNGTSDSLMLFSGASIEPIALEQYQVLKIPYYLFVPNNESATITYSAEQLIYENGIVASRIDAPALVHPAETLTTGDYEYSIRILEMIEDTEYYTITMTCDDQTLTFNITVKKAAEQINIKTDHLLFDFKPERYSNNASLEERLWSDTRNGVKYSMQIPEGAHFDWRTGGWITDANDVPCFCVKAGSRVQFVQQNVGSDNITPLTLFWHEMEGQGGSNFKCTFKIDNVKTPDAPFLTSLDTVTNTLVNYGKTILAEKQDIEDDDTLIHSYLNTKYIYTKTINSANKVVKEAIGMTVLNSEPFSTELGETQRAAAEDAARAKNTKNIKKYIGNIYKIANQASIQEHREYLLRLLSGKGASDVIDYETIASEIETYLMDLTNAQTAYNRLNAESNDTSTTTYAYRQVEPVNFDAMLNGFIVEGKAGKDGIIAMIEFTFVSEIKTSNVYSQTVSVDPISINSFSGTATFRVNVTNTQDNTTKEYEVEVVNDSGTYTSIYSIKDASDKEVRAYGLELNAMGSNIYLPSGVINYAHSEGDVIEFEYNINPEISGRINSSIIIYEDGVPSAAKLYATGNNIFEQDAPGYLTIGSDDCDVYIYKMRLYDQALSNQDILANFYADGLTTDEMMQRYSRNKTLVNASTITPQLIAQECPDLRVIMIEAPQLTGGKTSFIKNTKVRCIYKNGRPEDNWVALNAYHAGQGTSSDNYGVAGRNLDIIFGFNGEDTVIIPKPQKNNYTFDPSYKSIVITGLDDDNTNDIKTAAEYEAAGYDVVYNGQGKVSLSDTSVPNNWFNIKVNIASSENTNNAFLQKRFDRYLPYRDKVPAMKRDDRIKNDMEFFNCVIFIKETGTASEFTEDNSLAASERPWHFYGIGNLGDSKKTDSTRANIPGDPYEFCIEISDNGLKNSGFNSGVFYISNDSKTRSQNTNPDLSIISGAYTAHICESTEYTANGSTYTFSVGTPSTSTLYLVPITTDTFTYYRRFMYNAGAWKEIGEPITFTRTSYGCKYPISEAEWKCSLNEYHSALYDLTSGKGWDKSFEFRYDITTKDGETVARNDLEAAMNTLHQTANKKAFADMYSWIVTSTNTNFHDHLDEWFIEESPLYWYLFTERYTMIDSRAKNTFYHYGKVYISDDEANGTKVAELQAAAANPAAYASAHGIVASGNVTATQIAEQEIAFRLATAQFIQANAQYFTLDNNEAAINDGYRFEMWDYDDDTALGINNNGQMVFTAGLEDIDKDTTGWIYNEAESVIWRRIRENMYNELGALYVRLKVECFNAQNLIDEFDERQAEFPEELWRLDFERKYYRPFIDKGETTYLNDMANGRKKYQRRQFERNMAIYINSKYQRNGSYEPNDLISFRPQFDWREGLDTTITIKPYSTMYINFALGNLDNTGSDQTVSKRVQRGEEYTINASDYIHDFRNIQCIIYNASRLMSIEGLGKFYCQQFILGAAKKLTTLILGNADPDYTNYSMDEIGKLGLSDGLPLLETLDLQNIQFRQPPAVLSLDNFPLLKNLNATGCNIQSFTFKDGGMLEHVVFPQVLTKIEFKNLYNLADSYNEDDELIKGVELTGAANLTSYNSINSYSTSWEIVQNMLNNAGVDGITQLTLNDIHWEIGPISDLSVLETLQTNLGASKMSLAGYIKVTGSWSEAELSDYQALWPNVEFECTGTMTIKHKVTYKYDADTKGGAELYTMYVDDRDPYVDIVSNGTISEPTKPSTAQYNYVFGSRNAATGLYQRLTGWRLQGKTNPLTEESVQVITKDTVIETRFVGASRLYKIRWFMNRNDSRSLVKTSDSSVTYGEGYEVIAPTVADIIAAGKDTVTYEFSGNIINYHIFDGWEELPTNIQPDGNSDFYNIYAKWKDGSVNYDALEETTALTPEILLALSRSENVTDRTKVLAPFDTLSVTMGYEGPEGIDLVTTPLRFDDTTGYQPRIAGTSAARPQGIRPFHDSTQPFTLAIDFRFNITELKKLTQPTESILIGCEDRQVGSSVQSLKLFYDYSTDTVRVGFGDTISGTGINQSVAISSKDSNQSATDGSHRNRNIVVIRHPANKNYIEVYCGYNGSVNESTRRVYGLLKDYSQPDLYKQQINWPNSTTLNTDNPLVLGDRAMNAQQANMIAGIGTIYWAKYWEEDLGTGECMQIASWPHEQTTFAVEDYNGMDSRVMPSSSVGQPNIVLTTITASETQPLPISGSLATSVPTGTTIGWNNSELQKFANNRIFNGLPLTLQSIIAESSVNYMPAECIYESTIYMSNIYKVTSNVGTSRDLVFFPSYVELTNDSTNVYSFEANRGYTWSNANKADVWVYGASSSSATEGTGSIDYSRFRFPIVPLADKPQVYLYNYQQGTPLQERLSKSNKLERGVIMIVSNNPNVAYVYVTSADILNGAPVVPNEGVFYCSNDFGGGGWVPASPYWTRSVFDNNGTQYPFMYVNAGGALISQPPGYGVTGVLTCGLDYSIGI